MNFDFTIRAHGFEKAAMLEAALKKMNIAYEVTQSKAPVIKRTAKRIDKAEFMAVVNELQNHPNRTYADIARATGVHEQAVGKIAKGVHPLCKKHKISVMPKQQEVKK